MNIDIDLYLKMKQCSEKQSHDVGVRRDSEKVKS